MAVELFYRFGNKENFYVGAPSFQGSGGLNTGKIEEVIIERFQHGGDWPISKNILTKVEYVSQKFKDFPT
ncbi:hypothetical protein E1171_11000, partial [Cytophagales bacterium RKSG123]|nr:hypothetical protein [Xanthovirga aplysinae]